MSRFARMFTVLLLISVLPISAVVGQSTPEASQEKAVLYLGDPTAIKDAYIVVYKEGTTADKAQATEQKVANQGGVITYRYDLALPGFAATMSDALVKELLVDPRVAYIQADRMIPIPEPIDSKAAPASPKSEQATSTDDNQRLVDPAYGEKPTSDPAPKSSDDQSKVVVPNTTQPNAPWGLDRIDQRNWSANGSYTYNYTGAGVHVYIIDTGIRATHQQFGGRVRHDYTAINDGRGASDCNGHGTHVAGTVGGSTYGVAKGAILHAVRVFGCSGGTPTSVIIAAVNWVRANAIRPAIINMSLGGPGDVANNQAVESAVAAGITVVVASGNETLNACTRSPASATNVITVGASDYYDDVTYYSNYGTCVDIIAPGDYITSAWYDSDTAVNTLRGTSMAAPHVAGAAALYLQQKPTASPYAVTNALINSATLGRLSYLYGEPNLLLNSNVTGDCLMAYHRYFGGSNHFYTPNWQELGAGRNGFVYEGIIGYILPANCVTGSLPVYRYYHAAFTDRFYTTSFSELGNGGNGWAYEGIVGHVLGAPNSAFNTYPLYRYYSGQLTDHFYTTNFGELGNGTSVWRYEGTAGRIFSTVYR